MILQEKANQLIEIVESIDRNNIKVINSKYKIVNKIGDLLNISCRESIVVNVVFTFSVFMFFLFHGLNYIIVKDHLQYIGLYEYINMFLTFSFILILVYLYYNRPSKDIRNTMVSSIDEIRKQFGFYIESRLEAEYLYAAIIKRQDFKYHLNKVSTVFLFVLVIVANIFVTNFKDYQLSGYALGWCIVLGFILGIISVFTSYRKYIYDMVIVSIEQLKYDFDFIKK